MSPTLVKVGVGMRPCANVRCGYYAGCFLLFKLSHLLLFKLSHLLLLLTALCCLITAPPTCSCLGGRTSGGGYSGNSNGENIQLIKAVVCAGLYPNVIVAPAALCPTSAVASATARGDRRPSLDWYGKGERRYVQEGRGGEGVRVRDGSTTSCRESGLHVRL